MTRFGFVFKGPGRKQPTFFMLLCVAQADCNSEFPDLPLTMGAASLV